LSSQTATARSGDFRGTLTRRYAGGGLDHVWWSKVYGGVASSLTGGVALYGYDPSSLANVSSPDSWNLLTPAGQGFTYAYGFHPKMRLGAFLGLGITVDPLAFWSGFAFGATFSW
jgi:hypothetical protein